jgi:hypothetical protein
MNANIAVLHIAERRMHYWRDRLQAAFRAGNDEDASACQLLITEYDLLTSEAIARMRSQAVAFLSIYQVEAPPPAGAELTVPPHAEAAVRCASQ